MSNEEECAYFPTAMFASRVYLSVVKKTDEGYRTTALGGFRDSRYLSRREGWKTKNPQKTRLSEPTRALLLT